MATAGFVIALCAWVLGWVIPLILSVLAIVFSSIGLGRAGRVRKGRGLAIAGLVLGILSLVIPIAAVAIPAFSDYMRKSKTTEAQLHLQKIAKLAKRYYGETSELPTGTSAMLPAGGASPGCCGATPSNKCAPDPSAFAADPVWSKLDFRIDEPTYYRFQYSSNASGATVIAVGDVDCDGRAATYTLTISVSNGVPTTSIAVPPAGVY